MSSTDTAIVRPDSVVGSLRSAVFDGTIAPGSAVTEAFVSETFDVARPTARIAIDRLVAAGVLTREPHHAARVRQLERADILDLFAARAAIEIAAVEQLALAAAVPAGAQHAHEQLAALPEGQAYTSIDVAFHRGLVQGSGSARLPKLHDLLMGEVELAISQIASSRLRSIAEVSAEHGAILDAVGRGDAALAAELTRSHIRSSRDRLLAHLDPQHGR